VSEFVFKMPDLGEGTVDAEIVAWHAKPGDAVTEDQLIVEVMTDKAAVEVPAPVSGRVVSITGGPGDKVAVGSPLIVFEVGESPAATVPATPPATVGPATIAPAAAAPARVAPAAAATTPPAVAAPAESPAGRQGRVMASPANRRRAREAGIDLTTVVGSGPGGRILRGDVTAAGAATARTDSPSETTEIKVIGLRRLIAERMSEAKRNIPHFAYVEEVDVTELESLRHHLNSSRPTDAASLSYLPLVVMALIRVLESFPQCNALYDAARGVVVRHRAVHVGIATQTPDGLKVPVVRHAESLGLWQVAAQIRQLAERARSNKATRDELVGSTITVTSLGKLGGIASTPIINAPEVAILGLSKSAMKPVWDGKQFVPRLTLPLSLSYDHRVIDGASAARFNAYLGQVLADFRRVLL
jgi:2-oxoisovalerate dehydrogenase E2 component (dihydrolipoyl transacylase)